MTPAKKSGPPPAKKRGKPQRGSSGNTKPSQPTAAPQWPRRPAVDVHDPDGVRLQKLLAAAGVGSRRVCENLISQGRVSVDGHVVTELGVRIKASQTVHVDGVRVQLDESRVYLAFNKPIQITEIATASEDGLDPHSMRPKTYAPPWHGTAWSRGLQADWTEAIYTLLYSKPLYTSVTWWDFTDAHGKFWPFGGLLDDKLKPKESYLRIKKLQQDWGVAKTRPTTAPATRPA